MFKIANAGSPFPAQIASISVWIDALLSGRYSQARSSLRERLYRTNGESVVNHCCLGVMCDLVRPKLGDWITERSFRANGSVSSTYPPHAVLQFHGVNDHIARRLAEINDYGASFTVIAGALAATYGKAEFHNEAVAEWNAWIMERLILDPKLIHYLEKVA